MGAGHALTAMIGLAHNDKSPPSGGLDDVLVTRSVEVVAGTRNRRSLPNLQCNV